MIRASLLALSIALSVGAVYRAGVLAERRHTVAAVARAEKAEADARASVEAAHELAAANRRQAEAYQADAAQARTDAERIELARQAAAIAADSCRLPEETVPGDVHRALRGEPVSEDAGLPPSLRATMQALGKKGRRR